MSKSRFGFGAVALTGAIVWLVAQAETENPGTLNRGSDSGTQVVSGFIQDGKVLLDEARSTVGGLATDLGGAVEGDGTEQPPQGGLPLQVQPSDGG